MKTKIVIFKVLAAIIAVGGAFASVSANSAFAATSAYVRYTTATHVIKCTRVGDCNAGAFPCVVNVTIDGTTINNVSALITVPPNNNTCATAIAGTNTASAVLGTKTLPSGAKLH